MIDIEKFICSLINRASGFSVIKVIDIINALHNQGLDYQDGKIIRITPELKESEDEKIRKALIEDLREMKSSFHNISSINIDDAIRWLENQGKKEFAWSEEDTAIISRVISIVKWAAYTDHSHPILNDKGATELVERLNSLKDRVQPKQEWGDEDKKALKVVTDVFEQHGVNLFSYPAFVHWLKTLPNHITLNPYWKPSDAQIASLTIACDRNDRIGFDLTQLLRDLKKLREE